MKKAMPENVQVTIYHMAETPQETGWWISTATTNTNESVNHEGPFDSYTTAVEFLAGDLAYVK